MCVFLSVCLLQCISVSVCPPVRLWHGFAIDLLSLESLVKLSIETLSYSCNGFKISWNSTLNLLRLFCLLYSMTVILFFFIVSYDNRPIFYCLLRQSSCFSLSPMTIVLFFVVSCESRLIFYVVFYYNDLIFVFYDNRPIFHCLLRQLSYFYCLLWQPSYLPDSERRGLTVLSLTDDKNSIELRRQRQ